MRFEWDERKAAANLLKHGVRFEEAITAFDDPWALRAPDAAHSTVEEERIWLIGESGLDRRGRGLHGAATRPGNAHHQCTTRQPEGA